MFDRDAFTPDADIILAHCPRCGHDVPTLRAWSFGQLQLICLESGDVPHVR